jgi:hypothetical protein
MKNRSRPQNPMNREQLSSELIEKIKNMYPADFENDEDEDEEDEDDEDDEDTIRSDDFTFRYYRNITDFELGDNDAYYIRDIELYSTLDLIIAKYPETLSSLNEDRDNPSLKKVAMILNQLRHLNEESIKMVKDVDLLDMIRRPQSYQIATGELEDDMIGMMIYRNETIGNRINNESMTEFLNNLNFHEEDEENEWIGFKIITISVGLDLMRDEDTREFIDSFMENSIIKMVDISNPTDNPHNIMFMMSYKSEEDSDVEYREYIKNILHFFNTPISNIYNELYYIFNSEGYPIANDMRGGLKKKSSRKIVYKRKKSLKKKSLTRKSLKTKSTKRKSSRRKSSKTKSTKRKSSRTKSSKTKRKSSRRNSRKNSK